MSEKFPCSPYDETLGLVYFARMLDKIRLHAAGKLPDIYQRHLGRDFDGRCLTFLKIGYEPLRDRVLAGGTDEDHLKWCFQNGRQVSPEELEIWNGFMMKRGWRDEASDRITFRLKEAGLENCDREAVTMFDFIDLDEGRTPPNFRKWEPPRFS